MANFTIYKKVLMRGEKGDTGGGGNDTTVPQAGIIAYKGDTIPEGYTLYSEVPDGVLTHITATYTQTATITDASSLDELRPDLVVKAVYYDAETGITSEYVVTDYTLSGTLEVGTSTITASYKGFSDSFDVTVETSIVYLYEWDFTDSLTDKAQGLTASLSGESAEIYRDNSGVNIIGTRARIILGEIDLIGKTFEIDVSTFDYQGGNNEARIIDNSSGANVNLLGTNSLSFYDGNWKCHGYLSENSSTGNRDDAIYQSNANINDINGKTIKLVYGSGNVSYYIGDTLIGTVNRWFNSNNQHSCKYVSIFGAPPTSSGTSRYTAYNATITGVRIYETPQGGN